MRSLEDLGQSLYRIDRSGYKAYKGIQGAYDGEGRFTLFIDHVQGDPFAAPSKIRLRVPQHVACFPPELFKNRVRRIALEDFLAREVSRAAYGCRPGSRGSGKSGLITVDAGGQEVLERTAAVVRAEWVEARLEVGLPARGRRVSGREAATMLCEELPSIVETSLVYGKLPDDEVRKFVECVENNESIRGRLDDCGLVAFVADGAILPRATGATSRPLDKKDAVAFRTPESFRVTLKLANSLPNGAGEITGMGIPQGVTLIVGGGYHGKSTLLQALEMSVYPHVPADGRECVATLEDAVKIRAEDGRRVERVDISPFITNLPYGRSTRAFRSEDASGSTSQAANIVEAVEAGARVLLLDEDTSATNFMIRDGRMQELVHKEHEPITPFIDRVRDLYDVLGVSTVLVMGGCGDYFDVADHVIMMREYLPYDATEEARSVAQRCVSQRHAETPGTLTAPRRRIPLQRGFDASRGKRRVKIDVKSMDAILFGRDAIDLRGVEQLVDLAQVRAVGHAIHLATEKFMDGTRTLREVIEALDHFFDEEGLDPLDPFYRREEHPGNFARPRKHEVAAAINRLRTLHVEDDGSRE